MLDTGFHFKHIMCLKKKTFINVELCVSLMHLVKNCFLHCKLKASILVVEKQLGMICVASHFPPFFLLLFPATSQLATIGYRQNCSKRYVATKKNLNLYPQ